MIGAPDPNARPPFWKHRYYYLALKIIVLAAGILVAARLLSWFTAS
jgi:hypothetical protein